MVENYEIPDDYKGLFIDVNAAMWLGADHCWDLRYDYFLGPLQMLEW